MPEYSVFPSTLPGWFWYLFQRTLLFLGLLYRSNGALEYNFQIFNWWSGAWLASIHKNAFFKCTEIACVGFVDCHDLLLNHLGVGRLCSAKQIFLYFFNQWVLFQCTRIHMFFINLQLTHIKMLFCMSNFTSIRPSEYYFYNALCSFLTLEGSRHGIKDRWHKGKAWIWLKEESRSQ